MAAIVLFVLVPCAPTVAQQESRLSYIGIGLGTDLAALAPQYPHSQRTGSSIHVDPQDSHDDIWNIEVSAQRVRISFESTVAGQPQYPACARIEARLVADFGAPQSVRQFSEEATPHADRYWSSPKEELTLVCFVGPGNRLVAEAVVISPR